VTESMQSWARLVLDAEGLSDWTVKPGEAYCWIDDRVITFDFERYIGNYSLFLHEVAHALYPNKEGPLLNHYHGGEWAAVYGKLVNRYMMPKERKMRKLDKLVIVDVEATCWKDDSLHPSQLPRRDESEIIEIGVCTLDLKTLEFSGCQSILVKPVTSEISEFCTELTGWTQEDVDRRGMSLADACGILRKQYDTKNRSWASYGQYDANIFNRDCERKKVGYPFGKFHVNIKAVVETILGETLGMDEALKRFNLTLEGRHHKGSDDAWNIAKLYATILQRVRNAGI